MGRRKGIARQERHCEWCKLTMGVETIEDENHLLYNCDLQSSLYHSAIQKINSTNNNHTPVIDFMDILSKASIVGSNNNKAHTHHKSTHHISRNHTDPIAACAIDTNTNNCPKQNANITINLIAKYINDCFSRRRKLTQEAKVNSKNQKTASITKT